MTDELIITGFHRSGTSMVTQLLHSAGLFVGDDLLGARPSNPYGHFEDRAVVSLHDAILRDNDLNWQVGEPLIPSVLPDRWAAARGLVQQRRATHKRWGFKDPRVCLFLGMWKHLMPSAKFLIVFRSAVSSAYSLERRHATQMFGGEGPRRVHMRFWSEPDLALRMWLVHNEAILRFAAKYPEDVAAISFDAVAQGFPLVDLLNESWNLDLERTATHSVFDPGATQPRPYPMFVQDPDLVDRAMGVWRRLRELEQTSSFEKEPAIAT